MKEWETITDPFTAGFIKLSYYYQEEYQRNPHNFIASFKKFKIVRDCCEEIVKAYRRTGVMEECEAFGKDFTAYAQKHVGIKWTVLKNILTIIYALIENDKKYKHEQAV